MENTPFNIENIHSCYCEFPNVLQENEIKDFKLKVLHLNIQGLQSKLDNLKQLISEFVDVNLNIDCILLCETFINDSNAQLMNIRDDKT